MRFNQVWKKKRKTISFSEKFATQSAISFRTWFRTLPRAWIASSEDSTMCGAKNISVRKWEFHFVSLCVTTSWVDLWNLSKVPSVREKFHTDGKSEQKSESKNKKFWKTSKRTNDARWQLLYNLVDVGQFKIRGCPYITYYRMGGGVFPTYYDITWISRDPKFVLSHI